MARMTKQQRRIIEGLIWRGRWSDARIGKRFGFFPSSVTRIRNEIGRPPVSNSNIPPLKKDAIVRSILYGAEGDRKMAARHNYNLKTIRGIRRTLNEPEAQERAVRRQPGIWALFRRTNSQIEKLQSRISRKKAAKQSVKTDLHELGKLEARAYELFRMLPPFRQRKFFKEQKKQKSKSKK